MIVSDDGGIKEKNAGIALRCNKNIKFSHQRSPNIIKQKLIDACCYHYGYAMSDFEMENKIKTWGHANEFNNKEWYINKFNEIQIDGC